MSLLFRRAKAVRSLGFGALLDSRLQGVELQERSDCVCLSCSMAEVSRGRSCLSLIQFRALGLGALARQRAELGPLKVPCVSTWSCDVSFVSCAGCRADAARSHHVYYLKTALIIV